MRNGSLSEWIESLVGLVLFAMRWVSPSWGATLGRPCLANAVSPLAGAWSPNDDHDASSAITLHLL